MVQIGPQTASNQALAKDGRAELEARDQNRADSKIPDVPKFAVINVALLSIGVLARVALPCDSECSDLPA